MSNIVFLFALLALACQSTQLSMEERQKDAQLLGQSFETVIAKLKLKLDDPCIIEEPPTIARGVSGRTPNGHEVWLYLGTRQEAMYRLERDWTLKDFLKRPVKGIARKTHGRWSVVGTVIDYYHFN